jgi:mRNA interferase YafQ
MYKLSHSKQFKKDFKKIAKSGNFNFDKYHKVVNILLTGKKLPDKHKDHFLKGQLISFKECHITPDILLIYRKDSQILELYLLRIGSHSDLF